MLLLLPLPLLLLLLTPAVLGDIPAHCLTEQVLGEWTFALHATDEYASCTAAEVDKLPQTDTWAVTLTAPNMAADGKGNTGNWTLVYDEGILIELGGWTYFSYFEYASQSDGTTVSYCGKSIGWLHETIADGASSPKDWRCIVGAASGAETRTAVHKTLDPLARIDDADAVLGDNAELALRVNAAGLGWTATPRPFGYGMKARDLIRQLGTPATKPAVPERAALKAHRAVDPVALGLPAEFDWTNVDGVDYVPPVRNQHHCGSCFSFASTEAMGARVRVQTKNAQQPTLAPMDIVACSDQAQGCDGGFALLVGYYANAFGIVEESCFPYEGPVVNGTTSPDTCSQKCDNPPNVYRTGTYYYSGGYFGGCSEESMMRDLVANGPLAVSFNVTSAFQHYSGGVFQQPSAEVLAGTKTFEFGVVNHAVMLIGYGTLNGTPYWKVRNSWGTDWGLGGDFMILRGANELNIEEMAVVFADVKAYPAAAMGIVQK